MLQQCASHVVDALYKSSTLDTARRPIYQYATELTLSTIAAAISVLLLAALLGNALWGVIFLVVFISLRLPGGGYHASTYRNCFVLTNGVFLSSFIAAALLNQISNGIVFFVLLGSCACSHSKPTPSCFKTDSLQKQTYCPRDGRCWCSFHFAWSVLFFPLPVFYLLSICCGGRRNDDISKIARRNLK